MRDLWVAPVAQNGPIPSRASQNRATRPFCATIRRIGAAMRIDPKQHGWMTAPETMAVMAALGDARFVGGAVRNALLGVSVVDIDIAVPIPPEEAAARLRAKAIKVVETGLEHGTVTAIAGTHAFEVTSLRRDV